MNRQATAGERLSVLLDEAKRHAAVLEATIVRARSREVVAVDGRWSILAAPMTLL